MKNNKIKSFPHPVLTPLGDDGFSAPDISPSKYNLTIGHSGDVQSWKFEGLLDFDNPTISRLEAEGKISHGIHLECPRTLYREWFPIDPGGFSFEVPQEQLHGEVQCSAMAVAAESISTYCNLNQHPDYGKRTFKLNTGDIVAYAPTVLCHVYQDIDPVQKVSSFLDVKLDPDRGSKPPGLDPYQQRIKLLLGEDDFRNYRLILADPEKRHLLNSIFVLPAILQIISWLRERGSVLSELRSDLRWCRTLLARLEAEGINIRTVDSIDLFQKVQKLLQYPITRGFDELNKMQAINE